jgi:hypothetical protein
MSARRLSLTVFVCLCGWFAFSVGTAGAVVGQFGSSGEGAGEFDGSRGVAVDQASGDVYLMDFGNVRIDKFSGEGAFLLAWGWGVADGTFGLQTCTTTCYQGQTPDYGPGTGEFGLGVRGVAVDNEPLSPSYEDVYVPDPGNNRVEKFDSSGDFLGMFGKEVNEDGANLCVAGEKCQPGKEGGGAGEFDDITGAITVASNGDVYVGGNERVQVFGPEGVFVKQFAVGGGGTHSIAVDGASDLYVVNVKAPYTLSEYDSTGVLLRTLDGTGEPRSVALDASGDVFVDDLTASNPAGERHHLLEYGPAGEQLASFDPGDVDDGEGIAFGDSLDSVYVPNNGGVVRIVPAPAAGPQLFGGVSASGVEPSQATLNATVNSENNMTTYRFEYGPTSSYGPTAPSPEGSLSASFNDEPVSATITKLIPGTIYHYRVVATDTKGRTTTGADATFTTQPAVLIDSVSMTNVAATSATFEAELNPLGADATYRIEYDTSEYTAGGPPHGTDASEGPLGAGTIDVPISTHVAGLQPDTLYHYRVVAHDVREGSPYTVDSSDHTFTTQPATGGGAVLPDGRSWEMVSPVDKLGAALGPLNSGTIQASVDGSGISYVASAATEAGSAGNRSSENTQLLSVRGASGWTTRDIDTANETVGNFALDGSSEYRMFSPDLSLALVEPHSDTPLPPLPKGAKKTIYLRNDLSGGYEALVTAGNVQPGAEFGTGLNGASHIKFLDATKDLSHVVFGTSVALTANAVEAGPSQSLYEWAGGKIVLVSVLPNGEAVDRVDPESASLGYGNRSVRHAVSDDGSHIVWETGGAIRKQHLYLRDVARDERDETVQVDAAKGVKEVENDGLQFQTANSDGSRVFFTSTSRLTANSTASVGENVADLYVFEITSASGELLAGSLTDLTVDNHAGERADVQGVSGTSEDGTVVYFAAKGLLGNAPVSSAAGLTNLYVERYAKSAKAWSAPVLVAGLSGVDDAPSWGGGLGNTNLNLWHMTSRVSSDGGFLAFMSSRSLTGYDNRDANSGVPDEEVFLYDLSTGRVSCVSCDPTGARPVGVFDTDRVGLLVDPLGLVWSKRWLAASIPGWTSIGGGQAIYQSRYLSDSGRLFFDSPQALVPGDTNGTEDVYEFEPQGLGGCVPGSAGFEEATGGCVGLISSGGSGEESAFLDASETGDDVFFLTQAGLVPQDGDGLFDVYDARVCSDSRPCMPTPAVASPACSTSDSCKAAPTPQPEGLGAPSSQTFSGAGNILVPAAGTARPKSLTRAQKLARALRACGEKRRRKRAACERQARKRYGGAARAKRSRAKGSLVNKGLPVRAGR